MNYLRQFVATPQAGDQPTGAETIERLCDRVQSSTLLDDRRDAVRALKSLSKKFRLEVGTQSMEVLINVLNTDRNDVEIMGYTLETLCNVMSHEPTDEEMERPEVPDDLGAQFTEIFIKSTENLSELLSLLTEYDFHIRWPAVRLMTALLYNRAKEIQEVILVSPMGVSKLMDLLSDSREIIRNDALLLLIQLTKSNANIQKIVAFESAFDRLFEIISEEGSSDGGLVVEDCLLLLLNLLKNNVSNQNFFKEGSYIQRLSPFFELTQEADSQVGWSAQKVCNIHRMLTILRCLVSPENPQKQNTSSQNLMNKCGLLQKLSTILMASGVPADVLTETINTVSEMIRGNQGNQEYFASVMAPSNPPRPAIVVLLMSMVNEKQPFVLRCAVLYCFQSFLHKNEIGQSQIVQTLLPSSADANMISAGQLLCGGLFSTDPLSTWLASTALLHAIKDNNIEKEQLLRVQLATSLGNPPVSLLQQCINILAQGGKIQTRIGLLMLLCTWLTDCPLGVTTFLQNSSNIHFLISQVSSTEGDETEQLVQGLCAFLLGICVQSNDDEVENYDKPSLRNIIEKRIGFEAFSDQINRVTKHENYSRTAKQPQLNCKQPSDIIFDYAFTGLFKVLESDILKTVNPDATEKEEKEKQSRFEAHENIVTQYKDIIREQDEALNKVRSNFEETSEKFTKANSKLEELSQQIQELKDQNALLKAQKGFTTPVVDNNTEDSGRLQANVEDLKSEVRSKDEEIQKLKQDLTLAEAKALAITPEGGSGEPGDTAMLQATVNRLNIDIEDLRKNLSQKDEEVLQLKADLKESHNQLEHLRNEQSVNTAEADVALMAEKTTMTNRIKELDMRLRSMDESKRKAVEDKNTFQERLIKSNEDVLNLQQKVNSLEVEKEYLKKHADEANIDIIASKKEQEDLLVLLSDQDAKMDILKEKLKKYGEEFFEVDVEEEDDDNLNGQSYEDDEDNVEDN